jgi:hypothetical protein
VQCHVGRVAWPISFPRHHSLCTHPLRPALSSPRLTPHPSHQLPIFLDKLLDPVAAILLSVTAILLFGETGSNLPH